ncbi:hypothetical protein HK104_010063 [Borealophlyctis nickersoniae]|nr:hypothetical protein HK104_010063 [Borealophlyctis nickersoniae]
MRCYFCHHITCGNSAIDTTCDACNSFLFICSSDAHNGEDDERPCGCADNDSGAVFCEPCYFSEERSVKAKLENIRAAKKAEKEREEVEDAVSCIVRVRGIDREALEKWIEENATRDVSLKRTAGEAGLTEDGDKDSEEDEEGDKDEAEEENDQDNDDNEDEGDE